MSKKTILIIEDDKFLQSLVAKKLIEAGFEVLVSLDSKEAMAVLENNKPDLIVLDIILPIMNGFEILSMLKKDNATKNIPVIILSNLGQKEEIEKAMALGAVDFLIKVNFTPEEILRKIKSIVGS